MRTTGGRDVAWTSSSRNPTEPSITRPSIPLGRPPLIAVLAAVGLLVPSSASAQERVEGAGPWNAERALALVDRAREVRQRTFVDSTFRSYRAEARGFVYFFLDRTDSGERTPVKTDQIALEVFWRAPDQTHQRIVGLRDEKLLPTNIKYHLDHLTVVQDEFPDRIRLGDGDEVSDVVHPVAPGAEGFYDYRLADSLTISLPGAAEPVRVYGIQVKPRRMERPGFVGTIYVDRATAAIVRMRFTFTPASYVDPYLDYIRISLDNLLWEGKYWLPYRQEAELRRELPQLDFAAGSVIRGRFEIGPYVFNEPLPADVFRRGRVSIVPEAEREAFPFEEPIFSHIEEEGLDTPASIEDVRAQARDMVEDRYLSGLRRLRLYAPSASEIYRFDRAEGHFAGAGFTFVPGAGLTLRVRGGWAFGRERGTLSAALTTGGGIEIEGYVNRLEDIGPIPAASGVVNTLGGLISNDDWTDPYFATGVRLRAPAYGVLGGRVRAGVRYERHVSAEPVLDDHEAYRPLRPVDEGDLLALDVTAEWGGGPTPSDGWGGELRLTTSTFPLWAADLHYTSLETALAWSRADTWRDLDLSGRLDTGITNGPAQTLYLLGGRGTLLGHGFRHYVGDAFWLIRTEASRMLVSPWLALRAVASAGQTGTIDLDHDPPLPPPGWTGDPDGGPKASLGGGVGLFWDVMRVDVARGIGSGGDWAAAFSVANRFHGWL